MPKRPSYKLKWIQSEAQKAFYEDRADQFRAEVLRLRGVMSNTAYGLVVPLLNQSVDATPKPEKIELDPIFYECAVAFILLHARATSDLDLIPKGVFTWKGVPLVCR